MRSLSPTDAERLRLAFQRCRDMEGTLNQQLQAYADAGREIFPAYGEAVDRLVARLNQNGGGENAPHPGEAMPDFVLPNENGRLVMETDVTTGRPELPTPPGDYHIFYKQSPYEMISPWPPWSPYYYNPAWVQYVLEFLQGGYFLHDAPWRTWLLLAGRGLTHREDVGRGQLGALVRDGGAGHVLGCCGADYRRRRADLLYWRKRDPGAGRAGRHRPERLQRE